jgi:type VI secretion system protein VasG
MAEKKLVDQLFSRLTEEAIGALDQAVKYCKSKEHRYDHVELVHWLQQCLRLPDSDVHQVMKFFKISQTAVERELGAAMDDVALGYQGSPVISPRVRHLVHEAWLQASVGFADERIRTGHLLLAALYDGEGNDLLTAVAPSLARLPASELSSQFDLITKRSPEAVRIPAKPAAAPDRSAAPADRRFEAIARFTDDLTERARQGRLDPIIGRDQEIRLMVGILLRRQQNNPILTGEAGVGKTAVVEGLAARIAAKEVPEALQSVSIRVLDVVRLQAGAGVRGEFENRLKLLVDEVKAAGNIILFIDEAHTLIGAGGAEGRGDAANLLKPALARGELRTIAATTTDEYRKFIEEDPALKRRFQEVAISEPSEAKTVQMLRSLARVLEKHYGVMIFEEALAAAARLSARYVPSRQLPDKAVAALDTACARVTVSQKGIPASVEDTRRLIAGLKTELDSLEREKLLGADHAKRLEVAERNLAQAESRLQALEKRWQDELALVKMICDDRAKICAAGAKSKEAKTRSSRASLREHETKLAALQGDDPLVSAGVDQRAVASVVADWTGIPVGRVAKQDIKATLELVQALRRRVVGQDHALESIARRIRTAQAQLQDPNLPLGAFLLAGPSGTGKTETALALAEARYGSERNLVVFNMNEFKEEHTASTLLGAPPGYVGFGKGGLLTEAIRRRPYSVLLLDEFEKAHNSIKELFYQVLGAGWTKDREGRFIDFRNMLVLATTNASGDLIMEWCKDPQFAPDVETLEAKVRPELLRYFAPALLGRLVPIIYLPLSAEALANVIRLKLGRVQQRLQDNHEVQLVWHDNVLQLIAQRCTQVETGARMVDGIITNTLLPQISQELLQRLLDARPMKKVSVAVKDGTFAYEFE